jgi:hypothetical protein
MAIFQQLSCRKGTDSLVLAIPQHVAGQRSRWLQWWERIVLGILKNEGRRKFVSVLIDVLLKRDGSNCCIALGITMDG